MKSKKISKTFFVPKNKYQQTCLDIYNLLVENFSQTFFVGGMVRDIFLDHKFVNIDMATNAQPKTIVKLLQEHRYKVDVRAIQFGVIKIPVENNELEIVTFRKETYQNSRYPKISFTKTIDSDSKRRDFTINSLYFHQKTNTLFYPDGALDDIKKRILRSVGNPMKKFTEDPLRIVRAFRLDSDLSLTIENETELALQELLPLTHKLSKKLFEKEISAAKKLRTKKFLQKVFITT